MKIDSLKNSSYEPFGQAAVKVNMELYYHMLHWKTWFVQLLSSTEEAKQKMQAAIEKLLRILVMFSHLEKMKRLIELWVNRRKKRY